MEVKNKTWRDEDRCESGISRVEVSDSGGGGSGLPSDETSPA